MKLSIQSILRPLKDLCYPDLCYLCGEKTSPFEAGFCDECARERFEDPNIYREMSCNGIILPNEVRFQDAMYHFDKGGGLQKLMHALKYHHDLSLGRRLGYLLGKRLLDHPKLSAIESEKQLLIPVPLHPDKEKKRGYNQAQILVDGMCAAMSVASCNPESVRRTHFTKSQTGFTREQRQHNMKGVFEADAEVNGKFCIIADDVFTTGATTFELAETLLASGATGTGIVTIAQA